MNPAKHKLECKKTFPKTWSKKTSCVMRSGVKKRFEKIRKETSEPEKIKECTYCIKNGFCLNPHIGFMF